LLALGRRGVEGMILGACGSGEGRGGEERCVERDEAGALVEGRGRCEVLARRWG